MAPAVVLPLVVALAVSLVTTALHRRIRPDVSARLLTGAIVGTAVAVVPTMVVLAVGFLAHLSVLDGGLDWCRTVIGFHADVNPWVGGVATAVLIVGVVRLVRVLRAWRRHRCCDPGDPQVVESNELFAYSLPGPGRRVALSAGLVRSLDGDELAVVMAHERGHAEHRHDRHLLLADLAAALVPAVVPLRRRLRFVLERWADESAVIAVGGDREFVAFTLARVALAQADMPNGVAAFNGLGVAARVEALLQPRQLSHEGWWSSTMGVGVTVVMIAAAVQAHHLLGLLVTLCPG
jgi:Zn-dependent protease with chaperone function